MTRGAEWFNGLLPSGSAFKLTFNSQIRKLFKVLGLPADQVENESTNIFFDADPQNTRCLDEWDEQFAIFGPTATEQDRRDRVDAAWKETGGQSPGYIQGLLQSAGFDVYVHEAAEYFGAGDRVVGGSGKSCTPTACKLGDIGIVGAGNIVGGGYERLRVIKDPRPFVGGAVHIVGDTSIVGSGNIVGATQGILLINDLVETPPAALDDPDTWPYVWYIGAETFGDFANVSNERQDEFIRLIQKVRPRHTWIVLFINFG